MSLVQSAAPWEPGPGRCASREPVDRLGGKATLGGRPPKGATCATRAVEESSYRGCAFVLRLRDFVGEFDASGSFFCRKENHPNGRM